MKKLTLTIVCLLLFLTGCAPSSRAEFLKANDAILGIYGDTYNFGGEPHKVIGAFKEVEGYIADVYHTNVVLLNLKNSENEGNALADLYLKSNGNCYVINRKNKPVNGTVFVREHGDTAKNLIYACDDNVAFEDMMYFIVNGTTDANGNPQTLMFPLWDIAEQPMPEKKYNPKSAEENGAEITLAEYERIKEGMKYIAVKEIIGSAGNLVSEVEFGDYYTKMYSWYGADGISNAVITFSNGEVSTMAQIGLT